MFPFYFCLFKSVNLYLNWNLSAARYLIGIFRYIPFKFRFNAYQKKVGVWEYTDLNPLQQNFLDSRNTEYSVSFPLQQNNPKFWNMEYSGIFKKNLASTNNLRNHEYWNIPEYSQGSFFNFRFNTWERKVEPG